MTTFYTSDQHFNHDNIIGYVNRPFRDIQHMNEELIRRYNEVVRDEDTVMFLGDIFFKDKAWAEAAMRRLRGHKKLVMGNHDRVSVTQLKRWGFEEVWKKQVHDTIGDCACLLSHYPLEPVVHYVQFVLHGHTHTRNKREGSKIHVGVDAWDYYPASENSIIELMKEREKERADG